MQKITGSIFYYLNIITDALMYSSFYCGSNEHYIYYLLFLFKATASLANLSNKTK